MKIVQLCPYAMDRPGGVQRHIRDLSNWFAREGHETRIVAPPLPGQTPVRSGQLHEIGRAKSISLHGTAFEIAIAAPWAVKRMANDLRAWGADIIHMHTPWTPMVVGQLHKALQLPTVTTIHATLPEANGADLIDRYIRRSARKYIAKSQAIVTPSTAPLEMLRTISPGLSATVLPPCVDLSPFRDARAQGNTGDQIKLLFLGRFEPRKGVDVLLHAWPKIADALPTAQLTIAGHGEMRDQVHAAKSDRLCVVDHPSDATVCDLMGHADFFLAPAPYGESYGLVLAEAMSAGALPIAAANAGYRSILSGDGSSLLVPPGDPDALCARVIKLAGDPTQRVTLEEWQTKAARNSDVTFAGPQYLDLFRTVLAG